MCNSTLLARLIMKFIKQHDALVLLKACRGSVCTEIWKQLDEDNSGETLRGVLDFKGDQKRAKLSKVGIEACYKNNL